MKDEILSTGKIGTRYKRQWVFLIDCKFSRTGSLYAGKVAFHSMNKNDLYQNLVNFRDYRGKAAIMYTGKIPKNLDLDLNNDKSKIQ